MANLLRLSACLFILLSFNVFAVEAGFPYTEQKVTASDVAANDFFGSGIVIDGDTAIIGASGDDDKGPNSGSAYVYIRIDGVWTENTKLIAADGVSEDKFGYSIALDGDTAAIGAPFADGQSGWVYIFNRNNGVWTFHQKVGANDWAVSDLFGHSIALDGDTLLVGAFADDDVGSQSGSAYFFNRINGIWQQQQKIIASDGEANDYFGENIALDGDTALISAVSDNDNGDDSGAAYIFTRGNYGWSERQKLTASDISLYYFGSALALDDDTAIIGARGDDDNGGYSGSFFIFTQTNDIWTEQQKLTPSDGEANDYFGNSVSIDGDTALIGSSYDDDNGNNSGSAYIFSKKNSIWGEEQKIIASDGSTSDEFGWVVSIDGNTALIGAWLKDNPLDNSGGAYFYYLEAPHQDTPALITGTTSANVFVGGVGKGTFIATDIDGLADADYFTISIPPVNGQALINAETGNWVYMANNSFVGSDPFTVTITDDLGGITEQVISISASDVSDIDSDGAYDHQDNCPSLSNSDQANLDGDSQGDACDLDVDGDLILDSVEVAAGTDPNDPNEGPQEITETLGVNKNVPAMSGIGLLALGLSMLGLGAVRLRRK